MPHLESEGDVEILGEIGMVTQRQLENGRSGGAKRAWGAPTPRLGPCAPRPGKINIRRRR